MVPDVCLKYLSHVKKINLDGTGITDRGIRYLKNVQELSINNTKITKLGISYLSVVPLKKLSIKSCKFLERNVFSPFEFEYLEELDISETFIDDTSFITIFPNLKKLIANSTYIEGSCFRNFPILKHISLQSSKLVKAS